MQIQKAINQQIFSLDLTLSKSSSFCLGLGSLKAEPEFQFLHTLSQELSKLRGLQRKSETEKDKKFCGHLKWHACSVLSNYHSD